MENVRPTSNGMTFTSNDDLNDRIAIYKEHNRSNLSIFDVWIILAWLTRQELICNLRVLMEKNVNLEREVKGLLNINKGLKDDNTKLQKRVADFQTSIVCVAYLTR
jgi:hypothetical protein